MLNALGGETVVVAHYAVLAKPCPHILNRLVGLFAQQDMILAELNARIAGDMLDIRLVQPGMTDRRAAIVAEKMRSMVPVESVALEYREGFGAAP